MSFINSSKRRTTKVFQRRDSKSSHIARDSIIELKEFQPEHNLHTSTFHFRFATCTFAFWAAQISFGQQDALYINGYRADAATVALISALSVIASFVFLVMIGQLQDHEALASCFPVAKWGRRAAWYKVHLLLIGPLLALILNPPAPEICECNGMAVSCTDVLITTNISNATLGNIDAALPSEERKRCNVNSETNKCSKEPGILVEGAALSLKDKGCEEGDVCLPCGSYWKCSSQCDDNMNSKTCEDGSKPSDGYCPEELCPGGSKCCEHSNAVQDLDGYCPEDKCADSSIKDVFLDRMFLYVYSMVLLLALNWCGTAMRVAYEAATYEIFPFDQERIKVKAYLQLLFGLVFPAIGIVFGPIAFMGGPPSLPNWKTLFAGVGLWFITLACSYPCIEPMKDADQAATSLQMSPWENLKSIAKGKAFKIVALVEILNGVVNGNLSTLNVYWMMYVGKRTKHQASAMILPWALLGIFIPIFMIPFWLRILKKQKPKKFAVFGLCMHAVISPVIYFVLPSMGVELFWCFFIDFGLTEAVKSAKVYWRITAIGNVIDEDCHLLNGSRREATFVSAFVLCAAFSNGFLSQISLGLMTFFGVDTTKPDNPDTPCYHEEVHEQGEGGIQFLLFMFAVINPLMDVLQAFTITRFPLHIGEKQTEIEEKQMQSFKLPTTSTISVRRFSSAKRISTSNLSNFQTINESQGKTKSASITPMPG